MRLLTKVCLQLLPGALTAAANRAAHSLVILPLRRKVGVGEKEPPPCDRNVEHCFPFSDAGVAVQYWVLRVTRFVYV